MNHRIPNLPPFIRSDPSLWFAQIELIFESYGIFSQRARAGTLVSALDHEVVQTFGDLLTNNNHIENLYMEIKNRVTESFSVSPEAELRSVLRGEMVSDGKPSLMLSRIRHLGRGKCSDEVLRSIFLEHLSASCRAILAVSDINDLSRLALMADRIVAYDPSERNVSAISANSEIMNRLGELTTRLDEMSTRSRNHFKSNNKNHSRSRSKSQSRNNQSRDQGSKDKKFCYLHYKYGDKAYRCYKPCSYKSNSGNALIRLRHRHLLQRFCDFPKITGLTQVSQILPSEVAHHILTTGSPVAERARKLAPVKFSVAKSWFQEMEESGRCRPPCAAWASPLNMTL
ncbi:uncharacterized protein LOC122507261 [Leptopilina heterotoma]|uniref:uncharacterized protein LOC122507261 n=1 Tax=Leptopilina heterotoma TaxID=63436 RepID=UPI001CA94184|nr:uncharacterized protein LOC122507261 [Leptopilina heterotoma]